MFKYFSLVSKAALESRFYTLKFLRRKSKNKRTKKIPEAPIHCGEAFSSLQKSTLPLGDPDPNAMVPAYL